MTLEVDSARMALAWRWRTARAEYELFMPAATSAAVRVGAAFQPIAIVPKAVAKAA